MNLVILLSQLVLFVSGSHAADQVFTTYYHNDVPGSPVAATDQNGDLKWREENLPYGERYLQEYSSTGNSRWYTSHVHDQETELTYMGARYYVPVIGRFMGVDPVGFDEANIHSFNRYAYANNNPYKYVDPDGRAIEAAWDIANVVMDVSSMGMNLAAGNYGGAAVDAGGLIVDLAATVIPGVPGGAGSTIKAVRGADKVVDVANSGKNFAGKQTGNQRLKDLVNDDNVSSADRGWIKQEMNEVAGKKKSHLRNPPGKDLAHERGRENAKEYGYEHAHLKIRKDHRTQHKFDNWGKSNKERPV